MPCRNEVQYLKPGEPNIIDIGDPETGTDGLWDDLNGAWLNDETVTFALYEYDQDEPGEVGAAIANGTGPMNYVAASNGRYVGVTSPSAALVDGTKAWIYAIVTAGNKLNRKLLAIVSSNARRGC